MGVRLFSHSHEETEEQPCMEEGEVHIFFLIATIISFQEEKALSGKSKIIIEPC